jgi:hypothetical protein
MPPNEPVTAAPPKHPLYALTTYELKDRRLELEDAIQAASPGALAQADLRCALEAVLAEQEDRARLSRA